MKRILFLMGNGFDLNLELKTKFSDVKEEYLKRNSNDPVINEFKEVLKQDYENWSDFESALGKYTEKFNQNTKAKYLYQIKSFCNILIEKFMEEESRVNYVLNADKIFPVFKKSLTNLDEYLTKKSKQVISPIISLSSNNLDFQYDFITFNYTNILDECINVVKPKMNNQPFRSISNQYNTFKVNDNIGKILHIHGTLQENLILGVDNLDQIVNCDLANDEEFQWETVKTKMNEELEEDNDAEARRMITASSIICIFGMSFGETDVTWWKYILNWLKSDISRHLIIFYYDENNNNQYPSAEIQRKYKVKDLFFNVAGCDDKQERERCIKRVHIAKKNGKMFKMDLLFSDP